MSFLIEDDKLLKKYNKIYNKVRNSINKELGSNLLHNENYQKTKLKSYEGKVKKINNDKMPKECYLCICLSVILSNID